MVGKKILLNDAVRSTWIFWSNLEKKRQKTERENKGKKRLTLGFTLVLNISPVPWYLFLFWSSHKSSENRDTQDVRYQYDVRSMLRNMDYK